MGNFFRVTCPYLFRLDTVAYFPLLRNEIEGWLGDYYDQIHILGTYNLINNAAVMVEKNVGAAFCFRLENRYDNLKFVPLSPPLATGAVIVLKKAQMISRTMRQFIKRYKDILEGQYDS